MKTIVKIGSLFEVRSASGSVLKRFSTRAAAEAYIDALA